MENGQVLKSVFQIVMQVKLVSAVREIVNTSNIY